MTPITGTGPRSLELHHVLTNILPSDLTNIVDAYLAHTDAMEVLVLGTDGKPVDGTGNQITIEAIKCALTTATCDRDIIRQIFDNAANNNYTAWLSDVMNELRAGSKTINLENVNFSGLNLSNLNFASASMKNANFAGANLNEASFVAADLTSAEGLTDAHGQITVNGQTIFTHTGIQGSDRLSAMCGTDSCVIPLIGSRDRSGYLGLQLGSTWYLIRYRHLTE